MQRGTGGSGGHPATPSLISDQPGCTGSAETVPNTLLDERDCRVSALVRQSHLTRQGDFKAGCPLVCPLCALQSWVSPCVCVPFPLCSMFPLYGSCGSHSPGWFQSWLSPCGSPLAVPKLVVPLCVCVCGLSPCVCVRFPPLRFLSPCGSLPLRFPKQRIRDSKSNNLRLGTECVRTCAPCVRLAVRAPLRAPPCAPLARSPPLRLPLRSASCVYCVPPG